MTFKARVDWGVEIANAVILGKQGKSLSEIGLHYGVSRQRIKQVFISHGVNPQEIGVKLVAQRSREQRAAAHWKKWGNKEDTDLYHYQRIRYRAKKSNAKRLGVPFSVEFSELVWPTHCPILGIALDYFAESRQENSPSFDQNIPGQGYTKENTRIVSWRANRIKNNGTAEEHRLISEYLK